MRLLIQHQSRYRYPRPAALGPHAIRLRPVNHTRAKIETYSLRIEPEAALRWQQDPSGNHVARVTFEDGQRVDRFDVTVELAVDVRPNNPFDFFIDDRAERVPFAYPPEMTRDLAPFLASAASSPTGERLERFLATLPTEGKTVPFVVELNRIVNESIRYVIREETGIWTPEQTLAEGRGSCRDSAVLLIAALRSRGLAARFVSGYLVQLTDEGMIPDQPRGVGRDVVDLHAWAEVFLPGGGWIGLDATSGLLAGEGHIPLACTANPAFAAPIDGTSDVPAESIGFDMRVGRLGHEPRPTKPYEDAVFEALLARGDEVDQRLSAAKVTLTMGGEPTFNAREHVEAPEWNAEALGPTKWTAALTLANDLRARLAPGGVLLHRAGKQYPGESLPRWALEVIAEKGAPPAWTEASPGSLVAHGSTADARRVIERIARHLAIATAPIAAFEDPWRFLQEEANLPVDVDPLQANLDDPEERRRLARLLDRGVGAEVGFVIPIANAEGAWVSTEWSFRRGHLFLVPGDSPMGLRLPLRSLPDGDEVVPWEPSPSEPDPRTKPAEVPAQREISVPMAPSFRASRVRTALCVEPRGGIIYVFLPPLKTAEAFFELVRTIDAVRNEVGIDLVLEGYPPPASPSLMRFAVTPDPGVLEVNLPPTDTLRKYQELLETVFDSALRSGLHAEKYLVDGRQAGSGGGNHLTFGGPTALESPFVQRPDLLASVITFFQHHPSLSYLFTGLFVGPTSQAPRVDEARHDALYELEVALEKAFERPSSTPPAWLSDILFRHLLVDVAGSTHRAEICIDKLFSPFGAHGRQGLIELRAFEMPPHPRMVFAQALLVRALLASFAEEPYRGKLARFGQRLHDRFLLPFFLWRDFEDVLGFLASRGLALPEDAYRPFIELRCPVVGVLQAGDVTVEVRNAIEPWHVLGEEATATGTSRYVDSSVERIEIRAFGLTEERHRILVNGHDVPLFPTNRPDQRVAGVRFRAWAPPHSLHAHIGIHHPLRIDVLDTWGKRSLGACAYHVWHPEGVGYVSPPLTRFDASARRAQRFTVEGATPYPVVPIAAGSHADAPHTFDLRLYSMGRPPPP